MVFYKKDADGKPLKNKDGKKQLDKGKIAKAALNIGKMVADSQRTAPAPSGTDSSYLSLKDGEQKPQRESQDQLKGQMNGKTQQVTTDKNGKTTIGDSVSNDYQGGEDNMNAYKKRTKYRNPYA